MKTQDEINKAAESRRNYAGDRGNAIAECEFNAGANFANGYSVDEMCEFAEWVDDNAFKCNNKQYQLRGDNYTVYCITDLLKLWEESR